MPHAVIEYSNNLAQQVYDRQLTAAVHQAMMDSGLFNIPDIKTRSFACSDWLIGAAQNMPFVHVTVSLMEGRTTEQKQNLTQAIFDQLLQLMSDVPQLTVDIRDMTRATYRKRAS